MWFTKFQFLTRPNVVIVLLEFIDLLQFEGQHETNIWEGLPCPLPFYIAVFHFKHIAIMTIIKHIWPCTGKACFGLAVGCTGKARRLWRY